MQSSYVYCEIENIFSSVGISKLYIYVGVQILNDIFL